jgi:hypothetical protein
MDIAYNAFEREVLILADAVDVSEPTRRLARRRSLTVLASFTTAMLVTFVAPRLGFGLILDARVSDRWLQHQAENFKLVTKWPRLWVAWAERLTAVTRN